MQAIVPYGGHRDSVPEEPKGGVAVAEGGTEKAAGVAMGAEL